MNKKEILDLIYIISFKKFRDYENYINIKEYETFYILYLLFYISKELNIDIEKNFFQYILKLVSTNKDFIHFFTNNVEKTKVINKFAEMENSGLIAKNATALIKNDFVNFLHNVYLYKKELDYEN